MLVLLQDLFAFCFLRSRVQTVMFKFTLFLLKFFVCKLKMHTKQVGRTYTSMLIQSALRVGAGKVIMQGCNLWKDIAFYSLRFGEYSKQLLSWSAVFFKNLFFSAAVKRALQAKRGDWFLCTCKEAFLLLLSLLLADRPHRWLAAD